MFKKSLPLIIGFVIGLLFFLFFQFRNAGLCADGPCGFSNKTISIIAFFIPFLISLIITLFNKRKV